LALGASAVSSNYELIRDAIAQRAQVKAEYHGYRREMCPHVLGTKNGRAQALFYQFGGASQSGLQAAGSPDNWRCICVDELVDVEVVPGPWYTATHSRPQTCVDQVHASVD
jgi:hypothetical protein